MSIPDNQIERPTSRPYCDTEGCAGEVCQETGYCLVCESDEQEAAYKELCDMLDYHDFKGWEVS